MITNTSILSQIDPMLFWDVNLEALCEEKNQVYIIKRVITEGDKKDRDILFELYTKQQIKEVVLQTREIADTLKDVWLNVLN